MKHLFLSILPLLFMAPAAVAHPGHGDHANGAHEILAGGIFLGIASLVAIVAAVYWSRR